MSTPGPSFSESDVANIHDTYSTWMDLTDDHLEAYDPERDNLPEDIKRRFGREMSGYTEVVTRYNLLEQPAAGSCPKPYSTILERASVVVFQKIEPETDSSHYPIIRKVEFLNPLEALGGITLMMLTLTDRDALIPSIPEASVRQYGPDGLNADQLIPPRPFYDPDLTNNLLHLAVSIKRFSEDGKLVPIGIDDIQAMYQLQVDLESR